MIVVSDGTFLASDAIGWGSFPNGGEFAGAVNRRRRADWRHIVRARMRVAGAVNTTHGGVVQMQGSIDDGSNFGALGAYLDGGAGPEVFASRMNGNGAWTGAWCSVDVQYRIKNLLLRAWGVGGTGSGTPTFTHMGWEAVGWDARFASNSTAGASTHTRDIVAFGGSQIAGGGEPSDFQSGDARVATAKAILNPLAVLGHASGGWTYIRDGSTLTSIPNTHGIEVGLMTRLHGAGKLAGARFLGRYQDGTPTPDWVSTHFATLAADVASAGLSPSCVCYIVGGQDSISLQSVDNLKENLRKLAGKVENAWPGALFIVMGVAAQDAADFPQLANARLAGSRFMRDTIRGKRVWIPHDNVPIELQPDDTHATEGGTYDMGFSNYGAVVELQAA